jgi:hypothetical protein
VRQCLDAPKVELHCRSSRPCTSHVELNVVLRSLVRGSPLLSCSSSKCRIIIATRHPSLCSWESSPVSKLPVSQSEPVICLRESSHVVFFVELRVIVATWNPSFISWESSPSMIISRQEDSRETTRVPMFVSMWESSPSSPLILNS